jgi:hypothetical protein
MRIKGIFVLFLAVMAAAQAIAQSFTVTTPTNGSFIGLNNQVRFNITGAVQEVTVTATAVGPGGVTFSNNGRFTPDAEGRISSQLALNFNQGVPEGDYVLTVTATEPGQTYTPVVINVTLDVTKPKFLNFNPISGSFVKGGVIPIRVSVQEPNFKDYRIQVDGQDIPDNTGTTLVDGAFTVNWNTAGIEFDGSKTINIRLRDQADNEETRTFEVTLDRIAPSVIIVQPRANVRLAPRSNVSVAIDISDSSNGSTDVTGVDVVARTLTGGFIARVAVSNFAGVAANVNRWTGRLRWKSGMPKKFKLVVTVVDRAGNVAVTQEVIVEYR